MPKRYVATLAALAAGILIFGSLLKPRRPRAAEPPPVDGFRLARLAQRQSIENQGAFFAEIAARAAPALPRETFTVWLEYGESISFPNAPQGPSAPALPGDWLVAVSPAGGHQPAIASGTARARCGALEFEEVRTGLMLAPQFAGGALLDLEERPVAMLFLCHETVRAIAVESLRALRRTQAGDGLASRYGFGVAERGGVVVRWVDRLGVAGMGGLRAGDTIVALDGAAVARADDLAPLTLPPAVLEPRLTVKRVGRAAIVRLAAARAPAAPLTASGELVTAVPADSPEARAGLRVGDRIAGPKRTSGSGALVIHRGRHEIALWIEP